MLELKYRACEILAYEYESITFRLAPKTTYTPDFLKVFGERISEWQRMDVIGVDKDGFLCYDYDNAEFFVDEEDEPLLFCDECFAQFTEQEIIEQNNDNLQGVNNEKN